MALEIYFATRNSWPTVPLPPGVLPAWAMGGSGVAWPKRAGESRERWSRRGFSLTL